MLKVEKIVRKFIYRGILIGLMFPLFAIILCWNVLTVEEENTLLSLHYQFPLLWIIDSAPLVLALISYIVGKQVQKTNKNHLIEIKQINGELIKTNKELKRLISEKDVLFKEIHHRVKNNLQVITSLLSLQASFIDDENYKGLFRYSQYRINSMAMIHEMLYQSEDVSKINHSEYIEKLVSGLVYSMKGSANNITMKFDIPKIYLNIDTSIPLGLLINEIVTNSLKYGIKDKAIGTLSIKMIKHHGDNYELQIGDDGEGYPKDVNWRNANSLGLVLIHKLAIQLKGNIEKDNSKKGTHYLLHFKEVHQIS